MNTVTKTEVNVALKKIGLTNVSRVKDRDGNTCSYLNFAGKRIRGIEAGSIGPMTATNAWKEKNDRVLSKITETLVMDLGLSNTEPGIFVANKGTKKEFSLKVSEYLIPTHVYSLGYDRRRASRNPRTYA